MELNMTLTKSEFLVMEALWKRQTASNIHEILAEYASPKPAYTTVATFLKILTKKGFVDYQAGEGKSYRYFPKVGKIEYAQKMLATYKDKFFDNSITEMLTFILQEENVEESYIEYVVKDIEKHVGQAIDQNND